MPAKKNNDNTSIGLDAVKKRADNSIKTDESQLRQLKLSEIKKLRAEGKTTEALEKTNQALSVYPDDSDFLTLQGLIYLNKGDHIKAQQILSKVLSKHPYYVDARIGLVRIKMKQEEYQQALTLVEQGLSKKPQQKLLNKLKAEITSKINRSIKISNNIQSHKSILAEIKQLRKERKMTTALEKTNHALELYPDDADFLTLQGLIYYNMGDYNKAKKPLSTALAKHPEYTDARLGLIQINIKEKKFSQAKELINNGLRITPENKELLSLKKNVYVSQKQRPSPPPLTLEEKQIQKARAYSKQGKYREAIAILMSMVKHNPYDTEARLALTEIYLQRGHDTNALILVRQGLKLQPNNMALMLKEAHIQFLRYNYPLAYHKYTKVLKQYSDNKQAKQAQDEIRTISPFWTQGINEFGIWTNNTYASDVKKVWNYTSIYASRNTTYGLVTGEVNYANRLGFEGTQFGAIFYPRLNRDVYLELRAMFADQPALFPDKLFHAEMFVNVLERLQVSLGARNSDLGFTSFDTFTGSIHYYGDNYYISFRPRYYVPAFQSPTSLLYTWVFRRYFESQDHYINLTIGTGKTPDLANLLTTNFIVIRNDNVNLTYQFPVLNSKALMFLSGGYQDWKFPSGLNRRLYSGQIGIKYRN